MLSIDKTIQSMWSIIQNENNKLIKKSINSSENEIEILKKQRLRNLRVALEPFVFNQLNETYGHKLSEFWQTYLPPLRAKQTFVIIERRSHPNFWFVLRNLAWSGPSLSVVIFCSDENIAFIRGLLGDKASAFYLIPFFKKESPSDDPSSRRAIEEYNDLLTNYLVYQKIYELTGAEYMITVQMDNYFRKKLVPELFIDDYYGAPWGWNHETPGGSGVTFRRINLMIDICKKYRPDLSILIKEEGEDCWWNKVLVEEKAIIPHFRHRWRVIIESAHICVVEEGEKVSYYDHFIVHQAWTYVDLYYEFDFYLKYWRALLEIKI
jgi:hypothetical protein